MMDIRQTVENRMGILGITTADLARLLKGKVAQRTLYAFFSTSPINSDALGYILDALGLSIAPADPSVKSLPIAVVRKRLGKLLLKQWWAEDKRGHQIGDACKRFVDWLKE